MYDFLWGGSDGEKADHLVSHEFGFRPKEKGELGIGILALRNKALLVEWFFWRFPLERESLWYKVNKSKYRLRDNMLDFWETVRATHRNMWKYICSFYSEFLHVYLKLGGEVWEDVRNGDSSLSVMFLM